MILQSLYELYGRLEKEPEYEVAPFGFSLQPITFCVVLRPNGELFAIEDVRLREGNRARPRLLQVPGLTKSSGSGMNPGFLWDNTGYLLGYKPKDENPKRTRMTFEAFRDRHLKLESEIHSSRFSAVCRFLESWSPDRAREYPVLNEVNQGYGVFQIEGETRYVHEYPEIREWWCSQLASSGSTVHSQCLVTGEFGPIARLHPKIKRVGDQAEASLVTFNAPSFESYSKTQSLNAPVSRDAAFKCATALNALLAGRVRDRHRFELGDATVVVWTDRRTVAEDIVAHFFQYGSPEPSRGEAQDASLLNKLRLFLNALRKGREAYGELADDPDHTYFYMLGLTTQAQGRIGVRFFHRDTLATVLTHLRKHYGDMAIVRRFGDNSQRPDPEFPSIRQLLDETCPRRNGKPDREAIPPILEERARAENEIQLEPDREAIPPILEGPLLRSVITGVPYPAGLFAAILRRIRADGDINYVRACAIAGYLRRNLKWEVSMALDKERQDPAYRLGRLFAVLDKVQHEVLPEVKAGIRDRFYSAASATPGVVFPRLLRTYQHHLGKMDGGLKVFFERLVQDILGPVKEFPAQLGLSEQGLFALGYYHQARDLWTSKEDKQKEAEKGNRP